MLFHFTLEECSTNGILKKPKYMALLRCTFECVCIFFFFSQRVDSSSGCFGLVSRKNFTQN